MKKILISLIIAFLPLATLNAQSYFPNIQYFDIPDPVLEEELDQDIDTRRVLEKEAQKPSNSSDKLFGFKASKQLRDENIRAFLNRIKAKDPAVGKIWEQQLTQIDLFSDLDKEISKYNMSINNLSDAYTVWWINMWEGSRGIIDDTTDAQKIAAVRKQAILTLAQNPKHNKMTDREMQQASDELYLLAIMVASSLAALKDKPEELRAYITEIAQLGKVSGLDLDKMTLTQNGFVAAKK